MHSISKETLVEEDLVHVESLKIGFMVLCIVGGYHNIQHGTGSKSFVHY